MSNPIYYKRISGSSIQGDAYTVTEPNGTLVIANGGELRLHDGSTAGGNSIGGGGGGGSSGWQLTSSTAVVSLTSDGTLTIPGTIVGNSGALDLNYDGSVVLSGIPSVDAVIQTTTSGSSNTSTWTFGTDGSTTFPNDTILGTGTDPNVYVETSTTATTSTWTFGTNGILTLPAATPVIKGGGTGTDVTIIASTGSNTSTWVFAADGTLTVPGAITAADGQSPTLYASSGNAAVVSNYSGNNQLFVQDDGVYVQTSANNSGTTFTSWTFGTDGGLTLPLGGYITAPSAMGSNTVIQAPVSNRALLQNSDGTNLVAADDQGVAMTTVRGTVQFGYNLEAPGVPSHFHINKLDQTFDLFFGDDANYFHLPAGGAAPVIGAYGDSVQKLWTFGQDGGLIFPDTTVQTTAWTGTVAYSNVTGTPSIPSLGNFAFSGDTLSNTLSDASTLQVGGNNWTFGTDASTTIPGIVTLPNSGQIGSITGGSYGTEIKNTDGYVGGVQLNWTDQSLVRVDSDGINIITGGNGGPTWHFSGGDGGTLFTPGGVNIAGNRTTNNSNPFSSTSGAPVVIYTATSLSIIAVEIVVRALVDYGGSVELATIHAVKSPVNNTANIIVTGRVRQDGGSGSYGDTIYTVSLDGSNFLQVTAQPYGSNDANFIVTVTEFN